MTFPRYALTILYDAASLRPSVNGPPPQLRAKGTKRLGGGELTQTQLAGLCGIARLARHARRALKV